MQWYIIFRKEVVENWRNFKWIWFPLVIILIAIMDPITTYYLPQIIEATGGFPDGAVFEMPVPLPREAFMMSISQLSSLGVLVIVLMSMGTISGERKSGVTELILVKPVSYTNYITAKWTALLLMIWSSLLFGLLVSWYYVNLLYGDLSLLAALQTVFFYGLWLTLVATISIFYNTIFKSSGLVAFMSILTVIVMTIITQVFGKYLAWSPNNLSNQIHEMLVLHEVSTDLMITSLITIGCIVLIMTSAIYLFKNKEMAV